MIKMDCKKWIYFLLAGFMAALVSCSGPSGQAPVQGTTGAAAALQAQTNPAAETTALVTVPWASNPMPTTVQSTPSVTGAPATTAVPITMAPSTTMEAASGNADDWQLILVNGENWLPEKFSVRTAPVQNYKVDARVQKPALDMIAAAKEDGVGLLVCSAYRSVEKQTQLFENKIQRVINQYGYDRERAEQAAAAAVARPRTSEHHTGLALDIVTPSYQNLNDGYADTDAAKWLKANAADYGFILRYPKNKEAITGVVFEPWHYRYVGVSAAREIMSRGICLEEFLREKTAR